MKKEFFLDIVIPKILKENIAYLNIIKDNQDINTITDSLMLLSGLNSNDNLDQFENFYIYI